MKKVVDRVVQYPNRFRLVNIDTNQSIGVFDLYEEPGTVRREGTMIDAELFDSIEKDITAHVLTLDNIYPVGSIFISTSDVNPGSYLTGTAWERWGKGRVPVSVDEDQEEFEVVEKEGGEKTHTLTINEMPQHFHTGITYFYGDSGAKDKVPALQEVYSGLTHVNGTDGIVYTGSSGKGDAHNILQPYLTCYMWKRIS